jgi:Protein-tyrosine phosphatase
MRAWINLLSYFSLFILQMLRNVCLSVNKTDYINASLVEVVDVKRRYILTQGPLANTVNHFWSMVWEQVLNWNSTGAGSPTDSFRYCWLIVPKVISTDISVAEPDDFLAAPAPAPSFFL